MGNQSLADKRNGGESPDPQARGGRRSHKPVSETSLKNLRSWRPGESGNPHGRPKQLVEIMRLARSYAPEAIERLRSIMMDAETSPRDVIAAATALLDRGCGKAVVPVYRTASNMPVEMIEGSGDGEMTALLAAAGKDADGTYRDALKAELARLDAEEREEKSARKDEVDEAKAAMARGEPVSALMRMLVEVRDSTE